MIELTKAEKKVIKELIRTGILRRHAEWQKELRELLDTPFDYETENEFNRSMEITRKARDFYKEAMRMEDYYRTTMLLPSLGNLLIDGYLSEDDLRTLPAELRYWLGRYRE